MAQVNVLELRDKVKQMYKKVAESPQDTFHFETGKKLAERLGYSEKDLNAIPEKSIESFAGVGYHFDLADIKKDETVLDLGSGSGMDSFIAALKVGDKGKVIGIDMTKEQLKKAEILSKKNFKNIKFKMGYIEDIPIENSSIDVVISNGVINLCADKFKAFSEISRVLKKNGRIAISDIVSEKELTEGVTCNADIWASCIGGAMQQDKYKRTIKMVGMKILKFKENPQYTFLSKSAQGATKTFGVKSISLLAVKTI